MQDTFQRGNIGDPFARRRKPQPLQIFGYLRPHFLSISRASVSPLNPTFSRTELPTLIDPDRTQVPSLLFVHALQGILSMSDGQLSTT
jgi:hypothetical protein